MTALLRRVDWLATFTETLLQLQPDLDVVRVRPIAKRESRVHSGQPPEMVAQAYHRRIFVCTVAGADVARLPQAGATRPPRGQGVHLTHFRWERGA